LSLDAPRDLRHSRLTGDDSDFGLTAGNSFVVAVVLAALVPWFAALSAAYRFRLLDRVLGLDDAV
jgi:hypothetical protein